MRTSERPWLTLSYNMHGNEPLGEIVVNQLAGTPGMNAVNLHPEAAARGVRFIGNARELGGHFPGDINSSEPEDIAAAWARKRLQKAEEESGKGAFSTIIGDLHCTEQPDANYASTGELVWPEALAMAKMLGRTTVQLLPDYPFYGCFPNAVAIETTVQSTSELDGNVQLLSSQLRNVLGLGLTGLREAFLETGTEGMTFYKRFAYIMLTDDGNPDPRVMDVLEELEETPNPGRYQPVKISEHVGEATGIKPGIHIVNSWGHQNMSKPMPELGFQANGLPRRVCFADLLEEIAPPAVLGDRYLYFGYHGKQGQLSWAA